MKLLIFSTILLFFSAGYSQQNDFNRIQLSVDNEDFNKLNLNLEMLSTINLPVNGESFTGESESGTKYNLKDVEYDSLNSILRFVQISEDNGEFVEYTVSKLDRKRSKVEISANDIKSINGNAYRTVPCSNHTPSHSCVIINLRTCSEEEGCEF